MSRLGETGASGRISRLTAFRVADNGDVSQEQKETIRAYLLNKTADGRNISLDLVMASFSQDNETALKRAAESIAKLSSADTGKTAVGTPGDTLPRTIYFPYSRHSSYAELCRFVEASRPRDIWPCTVHPVKWLNEGMSPATPFVARDTDYLKGRVSGRCLGSTAPATPLSMTPRWMR